MPAHCLFCQIAAGEVPADLLYEDEHVIAFRDIAPAAPVHVLVVPRKHVASLSDLGEEDRDLAGRLLLAVRDVAEREGLADPGYRTVTNTGADGGQSVPHLHLHVLGGKQMAGHGTR